ncbi:MAG: PilZ domain-containing protein [Syntrophobacteraceae bacterium]|nr:PilZ domain-containing protein [Syntrophobacteraceae bacterium]
MSAWEPNVNRRKEPRFRVAWTATLTCHSAGPEEIVETRVTEISMNGARLQLKSLKIGPHHIVVGGESIRFTLKASLPQATFCAPVSIVWYSSGREKDCFEVGVMFLQSSRERRAAIEKLLADVALESLHLQ